MSTAAVTSAALFAVASPAAVAAAYGAPAYTLRNLLFGIAVLISTIFAAIFVQGFAYNSPRRLRGILALLVLAFAVSTSFAAFSNSTAPHTLLQLLMALLASGTINLVLSLIVGLIIDLRIIRHAFEGNSPRVVLLFDLASLLYLADPTSRWSLRTFEVVADRSKFAYSTLEGARTEELRKHAKVRAEAIRRVILRHAEVLQDREMGSIALQQSLLKVIRPVVERDWAPLLAEGPLASRVSAVRKYGPRVALSASLLAVAVGGPILLPDLIASPDQFRATVIVAAIFNLLAPDVHKAADALKSSWSKGNPG